MTDKDGASDSAIAEIDVEPEKDYPPTANAGEDIIIYLPQTQVQSFLTATLRVAVLWLPFFSIFFFFFFLKGRLSTPAIFQLHLNFNATKIYADTYLGMIHPH